MFIWADKRYGTGSGSDPRAIDPVATAPGTVPTAKPAEVRPTHKNKV